MEKKYAKYDKGNVVWEVRHDKIENTWDIHIDDIQGDMTVCFVNFEDLEFVDEKVYIERIKYLKHYLYA